MRRAVPAVAFPVVVCLALLGCTRDGGASNPQIVERAVTIATSLPLEGAGSADSIATNRMIQIYLDSLGNTVGGYAIVFKQYDTSTASGAPSDEVTCTATAQLQGATAGEVAVMGTHDDACDKVFAPLVNGTPETTLLQVSSSNTYPGMTVPWEPGEPEKYFPSGKRGFARVVTTDEQEGAAMASFAGNELDLKKCYVVNDGQSASQGVVRSFVAAAEVSGLEVLGSDPWDVSASSYKDLFNDMKVKDPDCLIISGIYGFNGRQLMKDKLAVLGNNSRVPVIASDGFLSSQGSLADAELEGVYITVPGLTLDELAASGGKPAALLAAYAAEYGSAPPTSGALYGTAAVQLILAAIVKSDGTRAGVRGAVFSGTGITIPAELSAIGKEFTIDPATGDTSAKDVSVLKIQSGQPSLVTSVSVS